MKKLLFVVDNLVMGGVTTVLLNLLNHMDYKKYEIDLLVLHYNSEEGVKLPSNVSLIKGDETYKYVDYAIGRIIKNKDIKGLCGKLWLVFLLKTGLIKNAIAKSRKKMLLKQYDTEIAFNDGFTQIFTAVGNAARKIAWLHSDVSVCDFSARYETLIYESLTCMDECVCVSKQVKKAYSEKYKIKIATVIHNIIDAEKIREKSNEEVDFLKSEETINLISVGRLCKAKNYFRFIRVHKMLLDSGLNINSYIVGDGEEKEQLENEIAKCGVADSFFLLGRRENPFPYMKKADVFVLSSDFEGLPTVLYEALVVGKPCVSTDVAGAEEIIVNDCGIITEKSDESLFSGISKMLRGEELSKYKKAAEEYKLSTDEIISQIENCL